MKGCILVEVLEYYVPLLVEIPRHDICQQIYATAVFGPKKSATKQRKCPKMAILRHLGVEMDN